jgi:hypothetical protein
MIWKPKIIKVKNKNFISLSNYPFSILLSFFGFLMVLMLKAPIIFGILFSLQLIEDIGFDITSYFIR